MDEPDSRPASSFLYLIKDIIKYKEGSASRLAQASDDLCSKCHWRQCRDLGDERRNTDAGADAKGHDRAIADVQRLGIRHAREDTERKVVGQVRALGIAGSCRPFFAGQVEISREVTFQLYARPLAQPAVEGATALQRVDAALNG